jgi:hypothetical protein
MIVRIRFRTGPKLNRKRHTNKRLALLVAALLPPLALAAGALAAWRIAADLKLAGNFAISSGFFSHWQVWMAGSAVLALCSYALNRYGKSEDRAAQ